MARKELNWFLSQRITVIDVDFERKDFREMVPLLWAVYSHYLRGKVLRIDVTAKGYHLMLLGNYPNVQLLFNADQRLNATKRLYIAKRDSETKKVRRHLIYMAPRDSILDVVDAVTTYQRKRSRRQRNRR